MGAPPAPLLVAGLGNIFFGDDGFGVEVAVRLAGMAGRGEIDLPGWVTVADYGIRGMHLAYDLASGYAAAILVDAAPRGGAPGTIYVIEPERRPAFAEAGQQCGGAPLDAHGMQPDVVLGVLGTLGADAARVLVVGCEPASAGPGIGLSGPVAAAVGEAVRVVLGLIAGDGWPPAG